jgi:MFS family permease
MSSGAAIWRPRENQMCAAASEPVPASRRPETVYVYAARAARAVGDGFAFIILPAYLSELGFDPFQIGVVATAALLGSAATTLAVGFLAARYDLRKLLLIGAAVMALTGLATANSDALASILIIVFIGSLNPSTGDLGMIVPLEHAMLARGAQDEDRTRVFARYSLIGTAATAAGALAAATPDFLVSLGAMRLDALRAMFYVYAALGALGVLLYRRLPRAAPQQANARAAGLGPSRRIVYKLAALFSLDAFAGGFVVPSILALWLFERFELSLAVASLYFFWANVLSALSYPVAARLARRFGLVNTMVFTHIPSSLCLMLAAFSPSLPIVLALLLVRAALAQMDVPTRTSYVMAVVTPAERAAAASVTAVPRSLASSISPALSGALLATSFAGLPLVACGVLKIVYDVALLLSFRHVKPPEERSAARTS